MVMIFFIRAIYPADDAELKLNVAVLSAIIVDWNQWNVIYLCDLTVLYRKTVIYYSNPTYFSKHLRKNTYYSIEQRSKYLDLISFVILLKVIKKGYVKVGFNAISHFMIFD